MPSPNQAHANKFTTARVLIAIEDADMGTMRVVVDGVCWWEEVGEVPVDVRVYVRQLEKRMGRTKREREKGE